jgi:hypothetical protein
MRMGSVSKVDTADRQCLDGTVVLCQTRQMGRAAFVLRNVCDLCRKEWGHCTWVSVGQTSLIGKQMESHFVL